jgi:hypothetical protein
MFRHQGGHPQGVFHIKAIKAQPANRPIEMIKILNFQNT